MHQIHLLQTLPTWAEHEPKSYQKIRFKNLHQIFRSLEGNKDWNPTIEFNCDCGCGRNFEIYHYGLNYHFPNSGYDHIVGFSQEKENIRQDSANQVDVAHFTNGVNNFKKITQFLEGIERAMNFKKNLFENTFFKVEFLFGSHVPQLTLLVEKNMGATKVVLHEITDSLPIVPLEKQAAAVIERLGIVIVCNLDKNPNCPPLTDEESESVQKFKASQLFSVLKEWTATVLELNKSLLSITEIVITSLTKQKEFA